jgi:hypothetical protein
MMENYELDDASIENAIQEDLNAMGTGESQDR